MSVQDHSLGALPASASDGGRLAVQEAQHRFFNGLVALRSLVQRGFVGFADPAVRTAAAKLDSQIMAFAEAQRGLAFQGGEELIDVPAYFGEVWSGLAATHLAPQEIQCELRADDGVMKARTAHSLALIVVELVTNAAKHAFGDRGHGQVRIYLRRTALGWLCGVQDNGEGIKSSHMGQGSALIAALARSLDADLKVHSGADGVLAWLTVSDPGASPFDPGGQRMSHSDLNRRSARAEWPGPC